MTNATLAYSPLTVPSGLTVEIRSRTYQEWSDYEDQRLASMRRLKEQGQEGQDAAVADALEQVKSLRDNLLRCQVKDFDSLRDKLTLRDIGCIETEVANLERYEIPQGNS